MDFINDIKAVHDIENFCKESLSWQCLPKFYKDARF